MEGITRTLYEIPINAKEKKALQFSFASKLVHMINPRLAVYDRGGELLLRSYRFLVAEYDRILKKGLLASAIEELRRRSQLPTDYSDQKIIDTVENW